LSTGSEYCIGIIVNSEDRNYESYNKQVIANEATRGIANQNDSMFSGKITKDMILKVANYGAKARRKNREQFDECLKTPDEICSELTKFLFEAGSVASDDEAIKYSKKAAKIIAACPDQDAFWTEFEADTSVPDRDIATGRYRTKSDFKRYFENEIHSRGIGSIESSVRKKFETSKLKAKVFFKLVRKIALKLGIKIPADADDAQKGRMNIEKTDVIRDMYIIVRKRMKYVDPEEKGAKK